MTETVRETNYFLQRHDMPCLYILTIYAVPCNILEMDRKKKAAVNWDEESIRKLREKLNLTQAELAEELGTRQQTISEWETGMYRPRGASAKLLSIVAERAKFSYKEK